MKTKADTNLLRSLTLALAISAAPGCASSPEPEPETINPTTAHPAASKPLTTSTARASSPTNKTQNITSGAASTLDRNATDQFNTPGAFSWQELNTTNVSGAKRFYRALLGWNTVDVPQGGGSKHAISYTTLKINDDDVGGIVAIPNPKQGDAAYWAPYVTVNDVDATARRARALGGTILIPPTDIPDFGRYSLIRDPQGAEFSIIRYAEESQ
jgi:predicted enzyme related to lactoylglutathione lyase